MIAALDQTNAYPARQYLTESILELARPADKALIREALVTDPELVELVVKFNWQQDCRELLVAMLRDEQQTYLPRAWLAAVASFRDPATYPALKAYLLRSGNRLQTYNTIRKLPGIEIRAAVDAAWKKARRGPDREKADAAGMAIDVGYPDALETLVGILRDNDLSDPQQLTRAATLIKRYTPATGDGAALVAWYDANKARLVFDPAKKKFTLLAPIPGAGQPANRDRAA